MSTTSSSGTNSEPVTQSNFLGKLFRRVTTDNPQTVRRLEAQFIGLLIIERLSQNGTFGNLTGDQQAVIDSKKKEIIEVLKQVQPTERSKYGNDIISGFYAPDFNNALIEHVKKLIGARATDLDQFLSSNITLPSQGGKRSRKTKSKKSKKSKSKKTKSRVRK